MNPVTNAQRTMFFKKSLFYSLFSKCHAVTLAKQKNNQTNPLSSVTSKAGLSEPRAFHTPTRPKFAARMAVNVIGPMLPVCRSLESRLL